MTHAPPPHVIMEAPVSLRLSRRTSAAAHLAGQVRHILTEQWWFITWTIVGLRGGKMINGIIIIIIIKRLLQTVSF